MLIKDLPIYERPRERLINFGANNLSNEELLSIILRCGTKSKSVKELSFDILNEFKTVSNLKNATISKLMSINGMGLSKSAIIIAMIELCRRIYFSCDNNGIVLNNPKLIYEHTKYLFNDKKQELFYCFTKFNILILQILI